MPSSHNRSLLTLIRSLLTLIRSVGSPEHPPVCEQLQQSNQATGFGFRFWGLHTCILLLISNDTHVSSSSRHSV